MTDQAYETMQNESVPALVYEQLQNESNMAQQPNTVTPQHTATPRPTQPLPVTQLPSPAPAPYLAPAEYPAEYVVQTNVPQAQPVSVTSPTTTPPGFRQFWAHNSAHRISVIMLVSGILLVVMNIPGIVIHANMWYSGFGFLGGAYIIVTGSIGIRAAKRKTKGFIIAWMVLTIILASVIAPTIVGLCSVGRMISIQVALALYVIGLVIGLLLVIISIVGSALTCRAVCCHHRPRPVQLVYLPTGSANVQFYTAGTNAVNPNAGQHPQTMAQYPANPPPTMVYPAGHPPNVHPYQPPQATGGGFNPAPYTEKQTV